MTKSAYQVRPGRALGQFHLGASLQETLARLKKSQLDKGSVEITHSSTDPPNTPILVTIHVDGVRLRFDGAEQRLRLIEVVDFGRSVFTYNGHEIYRPDTITNTQGGPNYRGVAKLFGPTFPPEYISPTKGSIQGTCILSYPGVAFSFPIDHKAWKPNSDTSALLSSSAARPASSLCIFHGRTWEEVRSTLFSPPASSNTNISSKFRNRTTSIPAPNMRTSDSISLVKIYGQGRLQLVRPTEATPISITLSETTPQDLISDLGPPDAIYHKSDRRLSIHQHSHSDRKSDHDSRSEEPDADTDKSYEHFYNYFRYGFDILISTPTAASPASPSMPEALQTQFTSGKHGAGATAAINAGAGMNVPVATKILLHANVPSSYDFGRYARCRWSLEHVPSATSTEPLTSEMKFDTIAARMRDVWGGFASGQNQDTKAMTLQRGWMSEDIDVGFGLGGSAEVVGMSSWEESSGGLSDEGRPGDEAAGETTQLFGYPGLVFEVLKDGAVGCLTVY